MPLKYLKKNIFEVEVDAVVNTVNCKGVMGKGLALEFKKKFPEMYQEYKEKCDKGELRIGYIHLFQIKQRKLDTKFKYILNFPTKNHWRHKSKKEFIEKGLAFFNEHADEYLSKGIKSVAFPKLGCHYGGLSWLNDVKPLMEKYLKNSKLDIYICLNEPLETGKKLKKETKNVTIEGTIFEISKRNVRSKFGDSICIEGKLVYDNHSTPIQIWGLTKKYTFEINDGDKVRLTGAYPKVINGKRFLIVSLDKGGCFKVLN